MAQTARVLITGSTGFVGRALVPALTGAGYVVRATVRLPREVTPGVEPVVVPDIASEKEWQGRLEGVTAVVHCAARAHILADRTTDPLAAFRRVNRDATLALAEEAAHAEVRRFVFVSSIGVLGESTTAGHPFREDSPAAPQSPYALSKWEAEQGLAEIAGRTGLEVVVVRPALVHGPGAPGNFGRLLRLVARGLPLPLAEVDGRRTFVGRENLSSLILKALQVSRPPGFPLLAGDAGSISLPDLLRLLGQAMGRPVRLFHVPGLSAARHLPVIGPPFRKLTDSLELDCSATYAALDWTPPVPLEEGLARMARAYRDSH